MIAFREEVATSCVGSKAKRILSPSDCGANGTVSTFTRGARRIAGFSRDAQATFIDPEGKLNFDDLDAHPSPRPISATAHFRIHLDGNFHGLFIGQTIMGRLMSVPPADFTPRRCQGRHLPRRPCRLGLTMCPDHAPQINRFGAAWRHDAVRTRPRHSRALQRRQSGRDQRHWRVDRRRAAAGDIREGAEGWFVRTGMIDRITRLFTFGRVGSYPLVVTVGLDQHHALAAWRSRTWTIVLMAIGGRYC